MNEKARNGIRSLGPYAASAITLVALFLTQSRACLSETKVDAGTVAANSARLDQAEKDLAELKDELEKRADQIDRVDREQYRRTSLIEEVKERVTTVEARLGRIENQLGEILMRLPQRQAVQH